MQALSTERMINCLMDKNKNLYQLQNGKDESYIKIELDLDSLASG